MLLNSDTRVSMNYNTYPYHQFSEGRVYLQCGKTLRPAKVTYPVVKTEGTEEDSTRKHHDANSQQANLSESTEAMAGKSKTIGSKTKPSQTKESCDHMSTRGEENFYTRPKHVQVCCLGFYVYEHMNILREGALFRKLEGY